jgi:DNA repair protein RecO (recombination protein O)
VELLRELIDHGQPQADVYDLAEETLLKLEQDAQVDGVLLQFEMSLLRLLGHQPSMTRCVGCDAPLLEDGPVYFGLLVSGVLCDRCVAGQRQVIRMREESRKIFALLSEQSGWESGWLTIPDQVRGECRAIIQRYLTVHFDRQWQLHRYLEDLAR